MESFRKHLILFVAASTLGLLLIGGAVGFAQDQGREAGGECPEASPVASPGASPAASPMASPAASPTPCPEGTPGTGDVAAGTEFMVEMVDIRFEPAALTIPANTAVRVILPNNGVAPHSFNIDALNIHTEDDPGGGSTEVTINAPAGTHEYYCDVPGHEAAGMVGTLTVQ